MGAFLIIDACDKMPNAISGFDLLLDTPFNEIVIVVHFGLESGLNFRWQYNLTDIERLDPNDGSLGHFGVMLPLRVSRSEIASSAD